MNSFLGLKLIHKDAKWPERKHISDAGLDLFSCVPVYILAGAQAVIRTGVQITSMSDYVLQVWSKSGLDAEKGLHVGAGIIDPDYRGEILVLLKNMSKEPVQIYVGDAVAQLVAVPLIRPVVLDVSDEKATERGGDGGIARYEIK